MGLLEKKLKKDFVSFNDILAEPNELAIADILVKFFGAINEKRGDKIENTLSPSALIHSLVANKKVNRETYCKIMAKRPKNEMVLWDDVWIKLINVDEARARGIATIIYGLSEIKTAEYIISLKKVRNQWLIFKTQYRL